MTIEANVNTTPDDDQLAEIESQAIEFQSDFESYNEAYHYFYNSFERSCYNSHCSTNY